MLVIIDINLAFQQMVTLKQFRRVYAHVEGDLPWNRVNSMSRDEFHIEVRQGRA